LVCLSMLLFQNLCIVLFTVLGIPLSSILCTCPNKCISCKLIVSVSGPGSSVGIATGYGLDGPGIESRWGEIFPTRPDQPWGPHSLLYNGYWVFPGGKAAGAWC
jgi:hypothetical protein